MNASSLELPFPCPFCHSSHVILVGGGLVFLHYECADCAEVWTAMASTKPTVVRSKAAPPKLTLEVTRKEKLWPH